MSASRSFIWLVAAIVGCNIVQPTRSHAQWWSHAPADFEECADIAEKAATKEAKASALSECNAKFSARRKPGGGYTYFDFMQDRSFDIAGPNPTPEEQKRIDQEYTVYLENQRRDNIAAAFALKQQQEQQPQQATFKPEPVRPDNFREAERVPLPVEAPNKREARIKMAKCARQTTFSCEWPKLSESIKDLKKALFGSSTTSSSTSPANSKAKRG